MLRQGLGNDIDVDEELEALEAQIIDEQAAAMPTVPTVRSFAAIITYKLVALYLHRLRACCTLAVQRI
jgi:hypothetical protein